MKEPLFSNEVVIASFRRLYPPGTMIYVHYLVKDENLVLYDRIDGTRRAQFRRSAMGIVLDCDISEGVVYLKVLIDQHIGWCWNGLFRRVREQQRSVPW